MTSDPVPPARTSGLLSVQQSGNVQALVTWPSSRPVYGSVTVPVPKARPVVSPTLIDSAPSKSPSRTLAGTFTGSSSLFRTSIKPAVKHFVEIHNSVTRGTRPGQQHGRLTPGTRVTAVTGTGPGRHGALRIRRARAVLCTSGSVYLRREGAGQARAGDRLRVSDAASCLVDKHGGGRMGRRRPAATMTPRHRAGAPGSALRGKAELGALCKFRFQKQLVSSAPRTLGDSGLDEASACPHQRGRKPDAPERSPGVSDCERRQTAEPPGLKTRPESPEGSPLHEASASP